MDCILTHQPPNEPLVSQPNTGTSHHDIMVPAHKKLLSPRTLNALSSDLKLGGRLRLHHRQGAIKRMSKSSFCLKHLAQEAHALTKSPGASLSMSKLGSWVPDSNPMAHNEFFHAQSKPVTLALHRRRRPMALKARKKILEENPRRKEFLLDDVGNLSRKMEEYRKQKKMGRYIHIEDGDSDEEDLE